MVCKIRRTNRNGLLLSWIVSYIIILLIAFIFILSGFFLLSRNLREETIRVHRANIRQAQIGLDYLLHEVSTILQETTLLPEVRSLGGFEGNLGPRQHYLKSKLHTELSKLRRSHPAVESLFVYFRPGEYIVATTGAYDVEYYFDTKYSQSSLSIDEWRSILFNDKKDIQAFSIMQNPFVNSTIPNTRNSQPHIQFFQTNFPMFDSEKTMISICVTVKETTIRDLLGRTNREGSVFILDEDNIVLLGGAEHANELPRYDRLMAERDEDLALNGRILTCFPSEHIDWLVVSLSSQSVVESRLNRLKWIFFGMFFVFWVIGTSAAYAFAQRNYRPVTRLIDRISAGDAGAEFEQFKREEYKYIEESFRRLRDEKASIQDQLLLQQQALKLNFLERLLLGKLNETTYTIEEQCEFHGFFFEEDAFVAVILQMEETVLSEEQLSEDHGAQWLSNRIRAIVSSSIRGAGWVCEINNLAVLLINMFVSSEGPEESLTRMLEEFNDRLHRETGITYTLGAGRIKTDIRGIPLAFEEAQEALGFRIVRGKGAVITYYEILEHDPHKDTVNTLQWERHFLNLFTSGDYLAAEEIIRDHLNNLEQCTSIAKLRMRLFGMINLFLDAMGDLFDDSFLAGLGCEERLLACTTLEETRLEIDRLFGEIRAHVMKNHEKSLGDRVVEIIEEHYDDPSFSVGFIADCLELSISNLSWMYKAETGHGPLNAIHRTRLREAKSLLLSSKLTVREVASRCGYLSDIAFIQVFKKYEGITPGRYRQQKRSILVQ